MRESLKGVRKPNRLRSRVVIYYDNAGVAGGHRVDGAQNVSSLELLLLLTHYLKFHGLEHNSLIPLHQHWKGYGEHLQFTKLTFVLFAVRNEWVKIGKARPFT